MKVLFFARARDLVGVGECDLDVATVAELRRALAERYPRLVPLLPHCAIAVNDEYVMDDAALSATDRIALLPPVSGG